MKYPIFVAATLVLALPMLGQPNPGGPVQLRNPHRGGGGFGGGGFGDRPGGGSGNPRFGGDFGPQNGNGFGRTDGMIRLENVASTPAPVPLVSMIVDGPFLFILRGDTLMQFDKKTLKMLNSVELPRPTPPMNAPAPNPGETRTYTAPPLRPGAGMQGGFGASDGVGF